MISSWPHEQRVSLRNLAHLNFSIVLFYINTLSPAVVGHMDPFFAEISVENLQKVIHSSDDVTAGQYGLEI